MLRHLAWFGLCALGFGLARPARATDADAETETLHGWVQSAEAQRNRVLSDRLGEKATLALEAVLARGATGCDCLPRRVRWAWALPDPKQRSHPSIVVSFDDRPRALPEVLAHVRFAFLRFHEGRYAVTSLVNLRRPTLAATGSLSVRILPRRDLDADGQLDIAVRFAERWPREQYCGTANFASSGPLIRVEEGACAVGEGAAD